MFAIEPSQTVSDFVTCTYGNRSGTCLEVESEHNLFQIKKKKKEIIWSDLSCLLRMVNLTLKEGKLACENSD